MINTARINTQSEKQCLFADNVTVGNWMIELSFDKAVLGCFDGNIFEEKTNTAYEFERDTIEDKVLFFNNQEYFSFGTVSNIVINKITPLRITWKKDKNNFETISIYSRRIHDSAMVIVPANDISLNYIYEPDESFTKAICLNRIAGYPYISKNPYDYNNPDTLCTE